MEQQPMTEAKDYRTKFRQLEPWHPLLIAGVQKELIRDHLTKDRAFSKTHFGSLIPQKIPLEKLVEVYRKVVDAHPEAEMIAEFILTRWILKNSDLYYLFEKSLNQITPDFASLTSIEEAAARSLLQEALPQFGAAKCYCFSIINEVVFSPELLEELRDKALTELVQREKDNECSLQQEAETSLQRRNEWLQAELQRQKERHEKKLLGLQRLHQKEVDAFKKQLASLQRQMARP